jgi:threonyl-tRNA synthetase
MKTGRKRERYYQLQQTKHSYRIWRSCFYGPKLDFMVKDALGRQWQLGTIQVDYNLPNVLIWHIKDLITNYIDLMIHRAPFGSMERFIAILLEHSRKFPTLVNAWTGYYIVFEWKIWNICEKVLDLLENNEIRASLTTETKQ